MSSKQKQSLKANFPLAISLAFVAIIFLLFPTHNSSSDAIGYAADIKFGGTTMFTPHHLLYNKFLEYLIFPIRILFPKVDVLALTKVFNALFALGILLTAYSILKIAYQYPKRKALILLLLIAFSFGFWRFSVENESYIIAIFFSLLGSLYFLKAQLANKRVYIFICGFFAALACLFHQIQFFWWLGLLVGIIWQKNLRKYIFLYLLPAAIVPAAYALVLSYIYQELLNPGNFIHFIFYSYFSGSAPIVIGFKNILFSLLALARTFIQVYPTQIHLLKLSYIYYLPILFGIVLVFFLVKRRGIILIKNTDFRNRLHLKYFCQSHMLILLLQFLFAAFSMGNAKFIIMLPLLIALIVPYYWHFDLFISKLIIVFFIVWNFAFGIWPDFHYNYYNSQYLADFHQKNQNAILITQNYGVSDRIRYATGKEKIRNLVDVSIQPIQRVRIDSFLNAGYVVYTDLINYPIVYNRDYFTYHLHNNSFWNQFHPIKIDSFQNFYGTVYLYQLNH